MNDEGFTVHTNTRKRKSKRHAMRERTLDERFAQREQAMSSYTTTVKGACSLARSSTHCL